MSRLVLIRHAHPDFPLGVRMCLGRTDTPLGALGRMQACLLGESWKDTSFTAVYSSPLIRCRETSAPLNGPIRLVPDLAEQDMGVWDGLDFDRIRAGWPELYEARTAQPLLVPEGAETLAEVQNRVMPALYACLEETGGDIAVVAHASVIQAILADVCSVPLENSHPLRPAYTAAAVFSYEDGKLKLMERDVLSTPPLTPQLAERLLSAAAPGDAVERHCRAVALEALRLAQALPLALDTDLLYGAALLHDAARREKNHAAVGAEWLRSLGYPEAAGIVAQHHDYYDRAIDEAALLFLADKLICEDQRVRLDDRFSASLSRCTGVEALQAHSRRYEAAKSLQKQINELCGYELIT